MRSELSRESQVGITPEPSGTGSGCIVWITGELTRFASCSIAMIRTAMPPNTGFVHAAGVGIASNLNAGLKMARERHAEWYWIMGDDHVWEPDIIHRLLAHNVDVVSPLVTKRSPPYEYVVYKDETSPGMFLAYTTEDLPPTGLVECAAVTNAGMMIRRHVLDAMAEPWFEIGRTNSAELGEDLYFCKKARAMGFKLYCDVDVRLGHTTPVTFWPGGGGTEGWRVDLDLGKGLRVPIHIEHTPAPETSG